MESRLRLSQALKDLGFDNVYFQPPQNANAQLKYPCAIYHLLGMPTEFADNKPYSQSERYTVTVIDRNPDSPFVKRVGGLPGSLLTTSFTKDELNHYVFNVHTQNI